jgi:cytochrome bd-type quinol oxidase subunit 2
MKGIPIYSFGFYYIYRLSRDRPAVEVAAVVTVGNAVTSEKTLFFLFWVAGVFVLPVIAIYTGLVYWVFRGKLRKGYGSVQKPQVAESSGVFVPISKG